MIFFIIFVYIFIFSHYFIIIIIVYLFYLFSFIFICRANRRYPDSIVHPTDVRFMSSLYPNALCPFWTYLRSVSNILAGQFRFASSDRGKSATTIWWSWICQLELRGPRRVWWGNGNAAQLRLNLAVWLLFILSVIVVCVTKLCVDQYEMKLSRKCQCSNQ